VSRKPGTAWGGGSHVVRPCPRVIPVGTFDAIPAAQPEAKHRTFSRWRSHAQNRGDVFCAPPPDSPKAKREDNRGKVREQLTEQEMTRKNSRPPRKRNTKRKQSGEQKRSRPRLHIEVTITSQVVPHVREYSSDGFKMLAKCRCRISGPQDSDEYTLFFDREKSASMALALQPGDRLILPDASFQPNPKRRFTSEIHARRISHADGWVDGKPHRQI
jgi:hypothetical protein